MILAYDIGGTSIKAGVFDNDVNLIKKIKHSYGSDAFKDEFPDILISNLFDIFQKFSTEFKISVIGCGVPGVVDSEGVVEVAPNMKNIRKYPLKKLLSSKVDVDVVLDNDANTAALAELYKGNGRGIRNFVYVTLGTGIGGAIIFNGKLYKGESGGAGEIGHIIIDYNNHSYDDRNYRYGTIEVLAGRQGILNLTSELLKDYPHSPLNQIDYDIQNISELSEVYDELSNEVLTITGNRIGTALSSVANILDIPTFIIGGGISKSKVLINEIKRTLVKRTIPSISKRINVINAHFMDDTGIYGAATLTKFIEY